MADVRASTDAIIPTAESPPPLAAVPASIPGAPRAPQRTPARVRIETNSGGVRPTRLRQLMGAAASSALLHGLAMVLLGCWLIDVERHDEPRVLIVTRYDNTPPRIETIKLETPRDVPVTLHTQDAVASPFKEPLAVTIDAPRPDTAAPKETLQLPTTLVTEVPAATTAAPGDYASAVSAGINGLRSAGGRRLAVVARGGTAASESAVDRALQWLVQHQLGDGSWNFDHRGGKCKGQCADPGVMVAARVAATSLALLPMLGAGHTHKDGPYKKQVQAGLSFLYRQLERDPHGDLTAGGTMYSHALATIVICEAYTMTRDRWLQIPAQRALNFITAAQDPLGGGWRYSPGQPGDTSVVGWQVMALKSGQNAYLNVPLATLGGASRFLDSVQIEDGAGYLYIESHREPRISTSAIGLLTRMYLGWSRDNRGLDQGVKRLALAGPSANDYYYNYYATQVLYHYDGPLWDDWNAKTRDLLVSQQVRQGHASGSWYTAGGQDEHNEVGGRLYCTAMATLTLEVYYRHLPLYRQQKADKPQP